MQSYAVRLTDLDGPRVALYTMKALQIEGRIAHSVDGYQLAYAVGRETAKRFGKGAVGLCPTTFNDGCAHGFVDALAEP